MIIRWLCSSTVRQVADLSHRVKKVLYSQWDILAPAARDTIQKARRETHEAIRSGAEKKALLAKASQLEEVANKWFKPYPNANLRENIDVILVALVVALGIRTFFLQPMAIPTGSMQPTLFGIMPSRPTYEPELIVPTLPLRVFDSLVRGIDYFHVVAKSDGVFRLIDPQPKMVFPFVKRQRFAVGSDHYSVWFPPEGLFAGAASFSGRVPVKEGQPFRKGDDIIRLKVTSGDRLFVDRVTYNFRHPERGEIIIFQTHGIPDIEQDTHYIKRLIALGGDTLRIGNDRHVHLKNAGGYERLDASTPRFENVYSFDPKSPPQENHYSGHVNNEIGLRHRDGVLLAPKFVNENDAVTVRPNHYLVFGDNTMNSRDSRAWGDFAQEKVVGKCAFVFWPISSRFGWGIR